METLMTEQGKERIFVTNVNITQKLDDHRITTNSAAFFFCIVFVLPFFLTVFSKDLKSEISKGL